MIGNRLCKNRFQGGLDQFVDKGGRRVVGAGKLPLRAFDLFAAGVAEKIEGPGRDIHIYVRLKLKQAFVDRAELFGTHIAVVDAHERGPGAE